MRGRPAQRGEHRQGGEPAANTEAPGPERRQARKGLESGAAHSGRRVLRVLSPQLLLQCQHLLPEALGEEGHGLRPHRRGDRRGAAAALELAVLLVHDQGPGSLHGQHTLQVVDLRRAHIRETQAGLGRVATTATRLHGQPKGHIELVGEEQAALAVAERAFAGRRARGDAAALEAWRELHSLEPLVQRRLSACSHILEGPVPVVAVRTVRPLLDDPTLIALVQGCHAGNGRARHGARSRRRFARLQLVKLADPGALLG